MLPKERSSSALWRELLTDVGIIRGVQYLYRMLVVILSGAIISTSGLKDNLQALVQLGLPYDVGFMCAIGIRFLPIFMEDIKKYSDGSRVTRD